MSKGGKIKPSQVLIGASGATGIAAGASLLGVATAPAAPFLGAAGAVLAGASKIAEMFGAGLNEKEIRRLNKIKTKHQGIVKRHGAKHPVKLGVGDVKFLDRLMKRKKQPIKRIKKGGSVVSGGSLKQKARGSKLEVWNGTARRTSGGLTKNDLMQNKRGKVVSKKKHAIGLKRFKENKLKPRTKEQMAELRKRKK